MKKKSCKTKPRKKRFTRNVYICKNKSCKFYGKTAAQGVCFSTRTFAGTNHDYIKRTEKAALEHLKHVKKNSKSKKDYIRRLESDVICTWMNHIFCLDDVVRQRAVNSKLRLKLGKYNE